MIPPLPQADIETKARYIRALYRQHKPTQREVKPGKLVIDQDKQAAQTRILQAEYERLFPDGSPRLDQLTVNVWAEERELAGQSYDYQSQCWHDAEGKRVD